MIKSLINRLLCREIQNVETRIYDWLTAIDNKETVPSEITAFNIGIFEQDEGYSIYLTGSEEYDADGDDWACDVDFEPANKYLELSGPGIKAMEWQEFQDMIVKIVSDYLDTSANTSTSVFAGRVVMVGFDDGQLVRVK
ncbi:hypothetical protein [Xylanibacter rodentium]|nr:hypothetical protein [Xylanibacter rodentium]NPE11399.1 hypothetical protein [Prevotella sp. PJ1A]NPE38838.1 hypothetical protein [Prevotella sp. PCJ2]